MKTYYVHLRTEGGEKTFMTFNNPGDPFHLIGDVLYLLKNHESLHKWKFVNIEVVFA